MKPRVRSLALLAAAVALGPPLAAERLGWGPDPSARAPRARTVRIADGRSLNVVDRGTGTPVVLVHGLPSFAAEWSEFPRALAATGHYRVIAYDRAGFGYSSRAEPEGGGFSYASNARDLAELLDALEIPRAVLVGWSYGGAVVQSFAQRNPERVSHLILVGSVGPALSTEPRNLLDRILLSPVAAPILSWVASVPPLSRAATHASLAEAFAEDTAIPAGWEETTRAMLALPGTLRAFALEMRRSDPSSLHPEAIQTPTLVVHGADDYLVPFAVGEDLHRRLPHSAFFPVLSGSHMLPVTHPEALAGRIGRFIRSSE